VKAQETRGFFLETTGFKRASGRWEDLEDDFGGLSPYSLIPHFRALHKESGTATQLARQVPLPLGGGAADPHPAFGHPLPKGEGHAL